MSDNQQPQFVTQESFQAFGKQLVDVLGQVAAGQNDIRKALAGQPAKPAPAPGDPGKPAVPQDQVQAILDGLARGDINPLQELVKQVAKQAATPDPRVDQLAQLATTDATEKISANQAHFRAEIDKSYGPGAYDKFFSDAVAEKFRDQPALQANRTYFQNVLNLVRGEKFDDLLTHKQSLDKAAADKAAAEEKERTQMAPYPFMLGTGVPTFAKDGKPQFNDEDRAFGAKFEDRMGEKFDFDRAGKILGAATRATREANSPTVSVSLDQLRAALNPPTEKVA